MLKKTTQRGHTHDQLSAIWRLKLELVSDAHELNTGGRESFFTQILLPLRAAPPLSF